MGWPSDFNGPNGLLITNGKYLQHEKFTGRWKKFETCAKDLLAFSKHIVSIEEVLDRKSALETEIGSKETMITSYKVGREQMLEGFAENYRSWKAQECKLTEDLQSARSKVQTLEETLESSRKNSIAPKGFDFRIQEERNKVDHLVAAAIKERSAEVQKLHKRIDIMAQTSKKEQKELSDKSLSLTVMAEQLRSCRKELEDGKRELGWEYLDTGFPSDLMELSMRLHYMVKRYFFNSLPKDTDADNLFMKLQQSQFMSTISRPIPISNTESSKLLRMAATEAIISMKLSERIFQPLSVLKSPDRRILCDILGRLTNRPKHEAILRTILTTLFASEANEASLVTSITEEVDQVLAPLFLNQVDRVAFKIDLKAFLHSAVETWRRTQKSPDKVIASSEGKAWDWGFHKEHESVVQVTSEQIALAPVYDYPVMVLFPRVYVDPEATPLHRGIALWSDQSVMIAGDLEFRDQAMRVNARNVELSRDNVTRRRSTKAPVTPALSRRRTVSLPSSPQESKSGNGTFLRRTQQKIGAVMVLDEIGG